MIKKYWPAVEGMTKRREATMAVDVYFNGTTMVKALNANAREKETKPKWSLSISLSEWNRVSHRVHRTTSSCPVPIASDWILWVQYPWCERVTRMATRDRCRRDRRWSWRFVVWHRSSPWRKYWEESRSEYEIPWRVPWRVKAKELTSNVVLKPTAHVRRERPRRNLLKRNPSLCARKSRAERARIWAMI